VTANAPMASGFVARLNDRLNVGPESWLALSQLSETLHQFGARRLKIVGPFRVPDKDAFAIAIEQKAGFGG